MITHQHGPDHQHRHHEAHNAHAGAGPVLVDVGSGAGALILHTGIEMLHAEIEISPVGQDERRSHVAVLARPLGGQVIHAAVYPTLAQGRWCLWDPERNVPAMTVEIHDGQVTEAQWPHPPA